MFGFSEMSGNMPLMLYLLFKDKVNRNGSHWPYLCECVSDECYEVGNEASQQRSLQEKRT